MKILELEIKNVRGIKDLTLHPNGKTFVVWGPNGTGKSGVIDSIDFLLTGKVTRLIGQGTKGLSLKAHGPHINTNPEDAYVRAKVKINGIKDPVELTREMSNPNNLQIIGCAKDVLIPITSIAERGQHVLTRREILRYITSESGTRAEQIQLLLNIYEIEKIRQNFVRISGNATKNVRGTSKALEQAKVGAISTSQDTSYNRNSILNFANIQREILSGEKISILESINLKKEINVPTLVLGSNQNITLIEKTIENLLTLESKSEKISKANSALIQVIQEIKESLDLTNAFDRQELIKLGIQTILKDEMEDCPLCDTVWGESKLIEYLNKKLLSIDRIRPLNAILEDNLALISKEVNFVKINIGRLLNVIKTVNELFKYEIEMKNWIEHLEKLSEALESPILNYLNFDLNGKELKQLLAPENIKTHLEEIITVLKVKFPKSSPEQDAWDILNKLEENIKAIEIAEIEHNNSKLIEKRAVLLQVEFEKSRDKVLNELYTDIQQRFVDLYIDLHGEDEKDFKAKLEPKGAALNFEVDFYGTGTHPPHALHSEGHQDSMGLCLFLALAEYLAEGIIEVILLDDVVMSVDADHRRSLCRLLAKSFPEKQFLITTHDKTWANQLRTEGIVNSSTSIEFYNWDLDSGPHVNFEKDIWKDVRKALDENNISEGAAKLRRGAESFFEAVCDALEAPVVYRQNRRWELGNFMPTAYGQYKKFIRSGKDAAGSWNNELDKEKFAELDSMATQIYTRTQAEQWGVNGVVHYNDWANLTKNDFTPIADSFEDLFSLFLCRVCGSMIKLIKNGANNEAIKCNCGNITWNLVKNKKVKI